MSSCPWLELSPIEIVSVKSAFLCIFTELSYPGYFTQRVQGQHSVCAIIWTYFMFRNLFFYVEIRMVY